MVDKHKFNKNYKALLHKESRTRRPLMIVYKSRAYALAHMNLDMKKYQSYQYFNSTWPIKLHIKDNLVGHSAYHRFYVIGDTLGIRGNTS